MNALGSSILALLATTVLLGNRRWALASLLAGVLFLTQAQTLNVAGFHLFAIRLLEIVAFLRVIVRGELQAMRMTCVDRAVLLLYGYTVTVFLLRSQEAWATVIGVAVDATTSYFICRSLLRNADDLRWCLHAYAVLLLPFVFLLTIEMTTQQNPFASIGGLTFVERGDRIRCMGSFRHPSLLGTVGAAFLPLYLALWRMGDQRGRALLGLVCCGAIILLSNSGGPISAAAVAMTGWAFWRFRRRMSKVRRTLAVLIVLLATFMKAPIWYLPAKASSFSGGDGWHRSYLMDIAFRRFDSWWLAGINMNATRDWFDYTLAVTGSADITNQYLYYGLTAGVAAIGLFMLLLKRAFSTLGASLAAARQRADSAGRSDEILLWGLGCCLLIHMATWFGITYNFDQTYVIWFMQLAGVSALSIDRTTSTVAPVSSRYRQLESSLRTGHDLGSSCGTGVRG